MCSTFSKCFSLWNFCCCLDSNPIGIYLLKHCPFNTLFCAKINAIKTQTQPQPTARTILHYDHFIFSLANKQKLYQQNPRKNEKVNRKVNILVGIKTNTHELALVWFWKRTRQCFSLAKSLCENLIYLADLLRLLNVTFGENFKHVTDAVTVTDAVNLSKNWVCFKNIQTDIKLPWKLSLT